MDVQNEKAFQKQVGVRVVKAKTTKGTRRARWFQDIGLGIKTPAAAVNGKYIDNKCPWTGDISIRGRLLRGVVVSNKMTRTIVLRRDYLHFVPKYRRFEKRHRNISAHLSPAFPAVKEGDIVTVGECRPLSKTVRFNVVEHEPLSAAASAKKVFRMF
jgi:small subunit ribosomal protein S11e